MYIISLGYPAGRESVKPKIDTKSNKQEPSSTSEDDSHQRMNQMYFCITSYSHMRLYSFPVMSMPYVFFGSDTYVSYEFRLDLLPNNLG